MEMEVELAHGRFEAETVNGRIEGKGKYYFPNGNHYEGAFKDGHFDGHGVIYFANGGQYEATWKGGIATEGRYTFSDGLIYQSEMWDYCQEDWDRRFYSERVNGIRPAGETQLTNEMEAPALPVGCFHTGDGYYKPEDGAIYDYKTNEILRKPDAEETDWIVKKCRKGEKAFQVPVSW